MAFYSITSSASDTRYLLANNAALARRDAYQQGAAARPSLPTPLN
jgi:hypothetical protein